MTTRIIFIYCLCDELLNAIKHHDDCQSKMSNAEIMTFAITAALYFHGNYAKIHLCPHRKRNAKRQHSFQLAAIQKHKRKRIETSFSSIVGNMPRHIHAVTFHGFALKVILFVVIFSLQHLARLGIT